MICSPNKLTSRIDKKETPTKIITSSPIKPTKTQGLNWVEIKAKISAIFVNEFNINFFSNMIMISETTHNNINSTPLDFKQFLFHFSPLIKRAVSKAYPKTLIENKLFQDLLKQQETKLYKETYIPLFNKVIGPWQNYFNTYCNKNLRKSFVSSNRIFGNSSVSECSFLINYQKHLNCFGYTYNDQVSMAKHKCGGTFLDIFDGKDQPAYFLCVNCKLLFLSTQVIILCGGCKKEYISCYEVNKEPEEILQPATWDKYHCGAIINDRMKCIKCREIFYFSELKNKLICKVCKFVTDPLSIVWSCVLCKKDFNSSARSYNETDFINIKNAIHKAITCKIRARPAVIPCCKLNLNAIFYHKKTCMGILYKGEYNKTKIVVCDKCKSMNFYDKYIWNCPKCALRFKGEIIENKIDEKAVLIPRGESRLDTPFEMTRNNSIILQTPMETPKQSNSNLMGQRKKSVKPMTLREILEERKAVSRMSSKADFDSNSNVNKSDILPINKQGKKFQVEDLIFYESRCVSRLDSINSLNDSSTSVSAQNLINLQNMSNTNTPQLNHQNDFKIEDYEIKEQIGEGSYGKIYQTVLKNDPKQKFAIKKIIAFNNNEIKHVLKEYELLNTISHSNVLKLNGMYMKQLELNNCLIYILMELASSDWQSEIKIRREKKDYYLEKELINLLKQLVDCLAYLQKVNITHRDIKPQNILIFEDCVYKLADFGDAKEINMEETNKHFYTLRGTELYMSPILFNAHKKGLKEIEHNTFKSDVFSLGYCLIYAASLSYKSLYDLRENNNKENILKTLNFYLKNRYSKEFINIINKMIEIEEKGRPDFIELSESLREL